MLNKQTFLNNDDLNKFFRDNCDDKGMSSFYLIKFIVSFNPFDRRTEFHIIYSTDPKLKAGEHMRTGGK